MAYQTQKLANVPMYVKSGTLWVPVSNVWTELGPFYNLTMEYAPDIQEISAQNAFFGTVPGDETFKISVEIAQWQQKAFFELFGGLAKISVDGSGNVTEVSFGGNADEIADCPLLFIHEKAGGGGFYLYFKKVYASGGGKFNIPEDKKIDKPVTMSVDLLAVCDTTLTDGEQLVTLKPHTTGSCVKPTLT
jgi:hypothetical protein